MNFLKRLKFQTLKKIFDFIYFLIQYNLNHLINFDIIDNFTRMLGILGIPGIDVF